MSRKLCARIAGSAFLIYIAAGVTAVSLGHRWLDAGGFVAQLAGMQEHAGAVRATAGLDLLMGLSAIVLAGTLHALTREVDPDLATMALVCRSGEGILALSGIGETLELLRLAGRAGEGGAGDPGAVRFLGGLLLGEGGYGRLPTAFLFAIGSALFCLLFRRARSVPRGLASFGLVSSLLLVGLLPLQLVGGLPATTARLAWIPKIAWLPMLLFELAFAGWLIFRGVSEPAERRG